MYKAFCRIENNIKVTLKTAMTLQMDNKTGKDKGIY